MLSAVAYVVVPMFQITPELSTLVLTKFRYQPAGLRRARQPGGSGRSGETLAGLVESVVVWLAAGFCAMTLWLQSRSKRAPRYHAAPVAFGHGLWSSPYCLL